MAMIDLLTGVVALAALAPLMYLSLQREEGE
jgi:hypothetical protein